MDANHTPGPYVAEHGQARGAWIKGSDGNWICLALGETEAEAVANRDFIIKALGSHQKLVDALNYVLERIWYDQDGEPQVKYPYDPQRVLDALAAAGVSYGK